MAFRVQRLAGLGGAAPSPEIIVIRPAATLSSAATGRCRARPVVGLGLLG